jgi:hypothetical protein
LTVRQLGGTPSIRLLNRSRRYLCAVPAINPPDAVAMVTAEFLLPPPIGPAMGLNELVLTELPLITLCSESRVMEFSSHPAIKTM